VASSVRIQSVEEEDAKRIGRERKYLIQQRSRVVSRIKGLLALHGIYVDVKGIGKRLTSVLTSLKTAEGVELPKFIRRDIERMVQHWKLLAEQIATVDKERAEAIRSEATFPHADKVSRLSKMGGVGEISATVLVAEVYHRKFGSRRHLASFIGLAPSPYSSGETSRDRGSTRLAPSWRDARWSSSPGSGYDTSLKANSRSGGTSGLGKPACAGERLESSRWPARSRSRFGATLSSG
jgi:transposase